MIKNVQSFFPDPDLQKNTIKDEEFLNLEFEEENPDLHMKSHDDFVIQVRILFKVQVQQDCRTFDDEMNTSKGFLGIQANLGHYQRDLDRLQLGHFDFFSNTFKNLK